MFQQKAVSPTIPLPVCVMVNELLEAELQLYFNFSAIYEEQIKIAFSSCVAGLSFSVHIFFINIDDTVHKMALIPEILIAFLAF